MKKLAYLAAVSVLALAAPAFAAEDTSAKAKVESNVEHKADGGYEESRKSVTEKTDAAGTETREETKVKVEQKADGDMEKTVKTETKVDPEGLMNQKKTVVEDKTEVKDGKATTHHTKKVDGKTVEDTKQEHR
jgi:hypothetical protein